MKKIVFPPLGWLAKLGDLLFVPIMYLVSGTFRESPQQTHHWNCVGLKSSQVDYLDSNKMVLCKKIQKSSPRLVFFFHLVILGGWRNYVVLKPAEECCHDWYIGWITLDDTIIGVSRIPISGSVRMTVGGKDIRFFGINRLGDQVFIKKIGTGIIGDGGLYSKIPLL